eukprot:CAMPEP_0184645016 /NCGR_PEP_ID=MMETSP0308-20130426/1587_1 /TAXON_ID=38269 /ORGANISM="Gloeochaete witrockiana, Strain SAG 46.84" /LENGTH=186 /DNA_ID=CAMNT_0027073797 /DNA_START=328 /DNA_END=888 /DNA_ORIENTATION=+
MASTDLRNNSVILIDNQVFKVIEFMHVKTARGSAFMRTKIKNVQTGAVQEKTFRGGESVQTAVIEKVDMQHTYMDGDDFVFMNMETFEEARLSQKEIGDRAKWIMADMICAVSTFNNTILDVDIPNNIDVEITYTEPGVKGNTAQGATKPATLNTVLGATVQVPLFINIGEKIKVNTVDCKYAGRS